MSDVIINVDDPEVIITEEYSADYTLPIASSTTLGGVKIGDNVNIASDGKISIPIASTTTAGVIKVGANLSIDENGVLNGQAGGSITVDSALSSVSTNPVQNRVITNVITSATGDIASLQGDISSINGDIADIEDSVSSVSTTVTTQGNSISALQTAVGTNTNNIATNTSNISANALAIEGLDTRLDTAEDNITSMSGAIATLQGTIDTLTVIFDEVATGTTIDNTIWTDGNVQIRRRGRTGVVYIALEGNLTINSFGSVLLYTQVNQDNLPAFKATSCIYTDDDVVYAEFNTDGTLYLYNNSNNNITLTYLEGSISVLYI